MVTTSHRLFDSRNGTGLGGVAAMIEADSTTVIQATGSDVPDGAVGLVMNLTYVNAKGDGYLTVYPADTTAPDTSNLNKTGPGPVANNVTVRLSSDGKIAIDNYGGATDLIGDVAGYYVPGSGAPGSQEPRNSGAAGPRGATGLTGDPGVKAPPASKAPREPGSAGYSRARFSRNVVQFAGLRWRRGR